MAGGKGGGQGGRGNKTGSHRKGAQVGSGGKGRGALQGKGPTPPADRRPGHVVAKRAAKAGGPAASGKQGKPAGRGPAGAGAGAGGTGRPRGSAQQGRAAGRPVKDAPEIVAGRNPVLEALRAEVPATALYVAQHIDSDERVKESLKRAADQGISLLEAPRPELDRMAGGITHQGLLLQVPPYAYAHPDDLAEEAYQTADQPLLVALDGVTDPRNLGAVVRSTAAFGGHGVVVPERRSAGMTAGAWKASAGTAARIPVARATNLTRTLEAYRKAGMVVVGLAADGTVELNDLEAAVDPLVLVVGSEGKGLSRLVAETCDILVRIPMGERAESLNAGVAAGIALYEIARRRRG